jgi:subtilase family serine protease
MRQAYGFDALLAGGGNGTGQTIAIIDAYDNPRFVSSSNTASYNTSDLYKFNQQFGLPQFGTPGGPTFTKVNQSGGTSYPSGNTGWGDEIALDVEWAHALAPGANIILVEAKSAYLDDLVTGTPATRFRAATLGAVDWARNQPGVSVISMSFAGGEFSDETSDDKYFTTPANHIGVSFVAATGDTGAPAGYPAYSPNVLAVGGTTLSLSGSIYNGETGWSDSGGGVSVYESEPSYQSALSFSGRAAPDVSFDADPNSGVPVYDSYSQGSTNPWIRFGGTSVSAPCWAALLAIANQGRTQAGLGTLGSATIPDLYALPATDFHDITSGNNGNAAAPGYDLVTGLGSPVANQLAADLIGSGPTVPDLAATSDSGVSSSDNLTNITLPTFTGHAPAQSTVQILSDGVVVGSGTATGGNYSITLTTPLADGPHSISARVGFVMSPGALPIVIDTVGPQLTSQAFNYDVPRQNITFSFNESVAGELHNTDLVLTNSYGTATTIPSANIIESNPDGQTAQFTFVNYPYNALPDGIYQATLSAGAVTDAAGNPLASNIVLNFFFLNGDLNHDGRVDSADISILSVNWNSSPRTFSQGDATYDGTVNVADLLALATNYQENLFA